jgi:hypothetical protein
MRPAPPRLATACRRRRPTQSQATAGVGHPIRRIEASPKQVDPATSFASSYCTSAGCPRRRRTTGRSPGRRRPYAPKHHRERRPSSNSGRPSSSMPSVSPSLKSPRPPLLFPPLNRAPGCSNRWRGEAPGPPCASVQSLKKLLAVSHLDP